MAEGLTGTGAGIIIRNSVTLAKCHPNTVPTTGSTSDRIQGIAPVSFMVRPEPSWPGWEYRSPNFAHDLQLGCQIDAQVCSLPTTCSTRISTTLNPFWPTQIHEIIGWAPYKPLRNSMTRSTPTHFAILPTP